MKKVNQAGRDVVADMKRTVGEGRCLRWGARTVPVQHMVCVVAVCLAKNTGDVQTAITDDSVWRQVLYREL